MSNSAMDKGGIYAGSLTSDTTVSLTSATVDASQSLIAKNIDSLAEALFEKTGIKINNPDEFNDLAVALYGTTNTTLAMNNSTVTGDVAILNDKGTTTVTMTNKSVVNGDVTVDGSTATTLLVDNSTVNGDVDTSHNSGNTTVTLQNNATVNGDVKNRLGR
ncbi:outer membrane autotransporter [Enterobacter cancerogenus]|uniref:Outer membrane autotransporter n=1 Tax=Enterobacter cancerogenus TaxID=69218 RepID=A0A484Y7I4_9ENTR|nr:outer membrane autotransporter [Enterobacter cancerogenus]